MVGVGERLNVGMTTSLVALLLVVFCPPPTRFWSGVEGDLYDDDEVFNLLLESDFGSGVGRQMGREV